MFFDHPFRCPDTIGMKRESRVNRELPRNCKSDPYKRIVSL